MDTKLVRQLRDISGAGVLNCQKALSQAKGDIDNALEILRKQGKEMVQNKSSRSTNEGIITAYIHTNNRIGVLIKLVCETDFVARNQEFKDLAHDIAMQVAAAAPRWIMPEDVPVQELDKEKEIYSQNIDKNKPSEIKEKIINGKLKKFYAETCLLEQTFIKDDKIIIKELIQNKIAKLGENIQVKKIVRFSL